MDDRRGDLPPTQDTSPGPVFEPCQPVVCREDEVVAVDVNTRDLRDDEPHSPSVISASPTHDTRGAMVRRRCHHDKRGHCSVLTGDLLCYSFLVIDRGINSHCRLCQALSPHPAPPEDYEHILTRCRATSDTRCSKLPGLYNTIAQYNDQHRLPTVSSHPILTQFIINCASLNLPADTCVPPDHPSHAAVSKQCSILINAILKDRTRQLTDMGLLGA